MAEASSVGLPGPAGGAVAGRKASLVATCDQWVRASHDRTAVDGADGVLMLSWDPPDPVPAPDGEDCLARGLATDRLCRIYRLGATRVDRQMVGSTAAGLDYGRLPDPVVIIGDPSAPDEHVPGPDFTAQPNSDVVDGVGIAIDDDDRLYVADRASRTISVLDLWSRRLMRTIRTDVPGAPDRHPVDVAAAPDGTVWALLDGAGPGGPGLLRFSATRGPTDQPVPASVDDLPPGAVPARLAILADGTPVVTFNDPAGGSWILAGSREPRLIGRISDIVVDNEAAVVIAPCPSPDGSATLRRLTPTDDGWTRSPPLDATGYDGTGLVVTRDGRIGYGTAAGFRLAVIGRVNYRTEGRCVTYRLDSGVPLNKWGRLFIEACLPEGTDCRVATISSDDEFASASTHADAEPAHCEPYERGETPPLPPDSILPRIEDITGRLHKRDRSSTPWWPTDPATGHSYHVFEAPVMAKPGRYLWVTLRLTGNRRRSPRIRELRVEHQAHGLLRRLPGVFSADEEQADFLHRYLAPFDGLLHDLELRSRCRDILLDPHGTPAEALDWLASFFGLALDSRWAEAARRQLIAEVVRLYRRRGTTWALSRYIELFLAGDRAADAGAALVKPVIVEHYRLRGLGGPLLGADPAVSSRSVVGHGFRVGGEVGNPDDTVLESGRGAGPGLSGDDSSAFSSTAHRFTVLIPRLLGAEEEATVRHILDVERPAHTTYTLCTVDAGMRVGRGLHVGLSSIVGPTGAFEGAVTDLSLLGRGAIVGGPTTGITVEAGRLGHNTRVG
ncbi:MAG: phage tail protein [Acidimicrobiia bacterium]|nr:phage tail protein [Acidimicrobiia bacterium]